jgi:hypothetical protein
LNQLFNQKKASLRFIQRMGFSGFKLKDIACRISTASISNLPDTVNKLSKSAAACLGNSPKVLQIRVDISLRSPARGEKIGCAANHNKHYTPDGKG